MSEIIGRKFVGVGGACDWPPAGLHSKSKIVKGKPDAQVKRENDAMVAAARESPDTEQHDGSAYGGSKLRRPVETARARVRCRVLQPPCEACERNTSHTPQP